MPGQRLSRVSAQGFLAAETDDPTAERQIMLFESADRTQQVLTRVVCQPGSVNGYGVSLPKSPLCQEEADRVSAPEQPLGDAPAPGDPESFSAFVARVLNQLSLSAWLPGAFFIVCAAALVWFRAKGTVTVDGAAIFVQQYWAPFLILAVPALVMSTLLTQAFSFEAIQKLEGYWRGRGAASWLRTICTKWQLRRKRSLKKRFEKAYAKGFMTARPNLLKHEGVDGLVLLAVEADANQSPRPDGLSEEQHDAADAFSWVSECNPWQAAKMLRLNTEWREFPVDGRVMPTRLGNLLRSVEDELDDEGALAGFVMRNRHLVPTRVLLHHDQFRTRLDMYCMLVFVSVGAAVISIPVLWNVSISGRIGVPLALLAMTWASYNAALASARGYIAALKEMNRIVKAH